MIDKTKYYQIKPTQIDDLRGGDKVVCGSKAWGVDVSKNCRMEYGVYLSVRAFTELLLSGVLTFWRHVGNGYRLIDPSVDVWQVGDECFSPGIPNDLWAQSIGGYFNESLIYRRRIEPEVTREDIAESAVARFLEPLPEGVEIPEGFEPRVDGKIDSGDRWYSSIALEWFDFHNSYGIHCSPHRWVVTPIKAPEKPEPVVARFKVDFRNSDRFVWKGHGFAGKQFEVVATEIVEAEK